MNGHDRRSQRGAGTTLTGAVAMVMIMTAFVTAWIVGWIVSGHRARTAADLIAVAAARAQAQDDDACQTALETAERNRVELTACKVTPGYGEFVVDVEVKAERLPRIGSEQFATAASRAGIVGGS